MRFTISNQTHDDLLCHFGKDARNEYIILIPPFSESAEFSPRCTSLLFSRRSQDASSKELIDVVEGASSVAIKLTPAPKRKWERVTVQGDLSWIIYRNRISRKHHVLAVFPYRDTSCFLASIPDSAPLSSLMLPGTHETMAFYGWPISQCQYRPLDTQLHAGIRVVDIRLSIIDDMLVIMHNFLTSPRTASETLVVSIKQEDSDTRLFPKLVLEEIVASPGGLQMWFLEHRIPNLGQVRGKAVMFSRFGGDGWENGANGIHPPLWPDSVKEGFQWDCDGTLVRIHDWYGVPSFFSIPEKVALSTELLTPPPDSPIPTLSISFMSAASIPFALPPVIARGFGWPKWGLGFEGVNDRVGKWLLDQLSSNNANRRRDPLDDNPRRCPLSKVDDAGPRIRGWVLMDYYEDPIDASVVPLFVECNFRGRRGW